MSHLDQVPNQLRCRNYSSAGDRSAFTLVELLVTISIIVILAAITLVSLQTVVEDAKAYRTQAKIVQLNELLMLRWETYRTRSVPIRIAAGTASKTAGTQRLDALHELMRMEMPDRRLDVISASTLFSRPALSRFYERRAKAILGSTWQTAWSEKYQGAECLYMIIASIQHGDRNGLDFFNDSDVGDKDGDKMLEFHDAWGNPIEFIRWAPGFTSLVQTGDPVKSPDPFDFFPPTTPVNFALHPFIFSAGGDQSYDVFGVVDDDVSTAPPSVDYAAMTPVSNPYTTVGAGTQKLGMRIDVNGDGIFSYPDNIHNHSLDGR